MKHSKVFKRPSGFRIKVESGLMTDGYRQEFRYSCYVQVCDIGKRKFRCPMDSTEGATSEEILEVEMELWEMVKPSRPQEAV